MFIRLDDVPFESHTAKMLVDVSSSLVSCVRESEMNKSSRNSTSLDFPTFPDTTRHNEMSQKINIERIIWMSRNKKTSAM